MILCINLFCVFILPCELFIVVFEYLYILIICEIVSPIFVFMLVKSFAFHV